MTSASLLISFTYGGPPRPRVAGKLTDLTAQKGLNLLQSVAIRGTCGSQPDPGKTTSGKSIISSNQHTPKEKKA